MFISEDIKYVGVNDHDIDLFEGQYAVKNGMSYNSYIITDEKIAVMDTADVHFGDEWLANIKAAIGTRTPDYLIVQHMEPDHSGNIARFMDIYKDTVIVSSQKSFTIMKNFFGTDYPDRKLVVKEGDTLNLGSHILSFVEAPMVHWPEVIVTYDSKDKVLFSADAFGKFGALDVEEDWEEEARRYYIGIVGKYGLQVQKLLKKASVLDIKTICPLHGPALSGDLGRCLSLYDTWSSYGTEKEGVVIAYTSVYEHTREAVKLLEQKLAEKGCPKVAVYDLARDDMAKALGDAFCFGKVVLATTTYNSGIFPFMNDFIHRLVEHNFSNRIVGFIENGSWAPAAEKVMKELLSKCKDLTLAENTVHIRSALNEENMAQIEALAGELCSNSEAAADHSEEPEKEEAPAKRYVCKICGYVHEGELPEDFVCPICCCGASEFELLP